MEFMDKWVTEFFLRRQPNPRVYATKLFLARKFVNSDDCKLKVTAILRDISNSLIRGTVDEGMLDLLEILEKLLLQEHLVIIGSIKSAYCWTATECTLRFMWPVTASDGFFSDAFERIWKKRIGILKERESDLVTQELLKWESDLLKAFDEPEIYQKIRETNIRYNAITHLTQLLKEQWALLGCSSLESEARKWFLKRKDKNAARESGRACDTNDNVNEEHIIGEKSKNRENTNDADEEIGVENPDGVDKVNEQEQEYEPVLNMGNITLARELKEFLLEIQGFIELSNRQRQGANNPVDHSLSVIPEADRANGTETESGQGTSSSSFEIVRPHLPSPVPLNVSPLKKGRLTNPRPRRAMKFWMPEELQALKEGVKRYGKSWKDIKNSNPVVFDDRTAIDLKDKWRNFFGRHK